MVFPSLSISRLLWCCMVVLLAMQPACEDEIPEPTEAEGGYRLSMKALQDRDKEAFWTFLDLETKRTFARHVIKLRRIDRYIQRYFDPTEREDLRRKTGAYILEMYRQRDCEKKITEVLEAEIEDKAVVTLKEGQSLDALIAKLSEHLIGDTLTLETLTLALEEAANPPQAAAPPPTPSPEDEATEDGAEAPPVPAPAKPLTLDDVAAQLIAQVNAKGPCEELEKARHLYDILVDLDKVQFGDDEVEGAKISEIEFNEEKTAARVISKSGMQYLMVLEPSQEYEDKIWHNATFVDKAEEDEDDEPEACNQQREAVKTAKSVEEEANLRDALITCEYQAILKAFNAQSNDDPFTFTRYLRPIRVSEKAIIFYAQENLNEESKRRQKLIGFFNQRVNGVAPPAPAPEDSPEPESPAPEEGEAPPPATEGEGNP